MIEFSKLLLFVVRKVENRRSQSNFVLRQSSNSQRSSTSAGHGLSSADYTGVGIVGRIDDADEDVQNIVAPNYASVGSSRYYSSANEAEDMQQRRVPTDLSHISSSAYRSSASQREESELQKNIGSGINDDGLRSYSQQRYGETDDDDVQKNVGSGYVSGGGSQRSYSQGSESSRTMSQVIPTYTSGSSHRSAASQTESELNESRRPVFSGQHIRISARPGTSNVIAVPVRVSQTTGVQSTDDQGHVQSRTSEYSSGSESGSTRVQHPVSTTYRVVYNPSRNYVTSDKIASGSDSESTRTVNSIPTSDKLTNYNSFNSGSQSRFNAEEEGDSQVRVTPGRVSYPSNGGSSRVASTGTSGSNYYQQRVAVAPITASESSSTSSRTAEEREERRYTPSVPTYITNSRVASANQDESRTQGGSVAGTYVIPVGSQTRYQTNQQTGSGSQSQYQSGASFSPYVPSHSYTGASSADRLSSRFGTGVSGVQTGDLQTFMSESERLARLQQQQIAGSSSGGSLSTYDANRRTVQNAANLDSAAANFVRTSNLASRTSDFDTASVDGGAARVGAGAGAGGFHNVRSWNKQSKWSSGN